MKENEECKIDSTERTEQLCKVYQDASGYYDTLMVKVDIKKYYYGLNNFYVVQILRDSAKDLYIVWTRWGRIGSQGQFQRTPFKTAVEAVKEFKKVFKQKCGWAWEDVKINYVKKAKKYDIKRF